VQIFAQRNQRHVDGRDIGVQNREHDGDYNQGQARVGWARGRRSRHKGRAILTKPMASEQTSASAFG